MSEPIETIIIRAQQDFAVVGGLNPVQIEIKDDRIINMLKKIQKRCLQNNTSRDTFSSNSNKRHKPDFHYCKKTKQNKKSVLNYRTFDILAIVDLNKINNWADVKGQSIWTNAPFKDHKEINNNNHLCFPFITRSFSDLTSFSIFLQDDTNKKVEFKSGEKKIIIFNFQIDIFLT